MLAAYAYARHYATCNCTHPIKLPYHSLAPGPYADVDIVKLTFRMVAEISYGLI